MRVSDFTYKNNNGAMTVYILCINGTYTPCGILYKDVRINREIEKVKIQIARILFAIRILRLCKNRKSVNINPWIAPRSVMIDIKVIK